MTFRGQLASCMACTHSSVMPELIFKDILYKCSQLAIDKCLIPMSVISLFPSRTTFYLPKISVFR